MRDFKGLAVWRKGHALALNVHRVVRTLPRSGYNTLKTQITKSAESIPFNIVEGCGAATQREFARYLDISIKSSGELEYQLSLGHEYGVVSHRDWLRLTEDTIEERRMLCGLRKKVLGDAEDE